MLHTYKYYHGPQTIDLVIFTSSLWIDNDKYIPKLHSSNLLLHPLVYGHSLGDAVVCIPEDITYQARYIMLDSNGDGVQTHQDYLIYYGIHHYEI